MLENYIAVVVTACVAPSSDAWRKKLASKGCGGIPLLGRRGDRAPIRRCAVGVAEGAEAAMGGEGDDRGE